MDDFWDNKADAISRSDNLRDVRPLREYKDGFGKIHYVFTKMIFHNPKYIIPIDDFTLFYNFLNGGSREYPSDGNAPVDLIAEEARIVLRKIHKIAEDPTHKFHSSAKKLLRVGDAELVRGTIKLYLGNYTTRDWRRKRSTDDIDFWISDNSLLEFILSNDPSWRKNKTTREWEKKLVWVDMWSGRLKSEIITASNDTVQGLDFGSGTYLEGSSLKDIIKKKIVRGHDVDLSDIINVAIVNNIPKSNEKKSPWLAFEEAANMRHRRVTSNLISLCRYSHGIADYLKRVSASIGIFRNIVKDQLKFPNPDIMKICKISSHWLLKEVPREADATRERIYKNISVMEWKKLQYSNTLREFAYRVFELLNSKYESANVSLEIQE